jgi:flagellum-specific ATP synthase
MPPSPLEAHLKQVRTTSLSPARFGKVQSVVGLLVEARGLNAAVGELCYIDSPDDPNASRIKAEVVGVREGTTVLMPLEKTVGLRAGCLVRRSALPLTVDVGDALLGRVVDANANPLDKKGPLTLPDEQPVHRDPPSPLERRLISTQLPTGIRTIDAFLPLGKGQRIGIFAGSGVGKSTLLGMIARNAQADINVVALIGERGREVREFISDSLGPEGLARSIVIAVTGEKAAMSRVKGAGVALAIAEYFRDRGNDVLLMMDSITRVAMAQREIGLAVGEPPTTRGYTPSVFAELPRLLERAGPAQGGSITGIFTVLVEGDDLNEPVSDAVRGTVDGHIVLSRDLAQSNHYPAIDVLQSVSRLMGRVASPEHQEAAEEARQLLASYRQVEDLVSVGAYERGSDPDTDRAIEAYPQLMDFLQQSVHEVPNRPPAESLQQLLQSI